MNIVADVFFCRVLDGFMRGEQRTDFRINKTWTRVKWKTTLYGELVNLTDKTNYRLDSFNGYNSRTGLTSLTFDKLFPILPSLGVVVER